MKDVEHWGLDFRINGHRVLTIESNCLSGKDLTEKEYEMIRFAAKHLLAFAGDGDSSLYPDFGQNSENSN